MRLPKTVGQTVGILGALVIGTVLMRKLCLPHGDDCILDRSDLIIAAFWIPVIMVKYRGTAYRSYTQKTTRKPCIHQPAAFGSSYIQISFDFNRIKPIINVVISILLPLLIYLIIKSKALFSAKAKH